MLDLKLDPVTWDVVLVGGDIQTVSQLDETVQHVSQRLKMFYGEWFLDLAAGVPWLQEILDKPQDLDTVEAVLKSTIQDSPGVAGLTAFSVDESAQARAIAVSFTMRLQTGDTISRSVELEI